MPTRHKQKVVDLTGPWRTTGLPSGAKLELVVKSNTTSVVTIRVDIQSSTPGEPTVQRELDKIPTSMNLWQVLRQAEETGEKKLNITARATPRVANRPLAGVGSGQLYYEAPVVNIIGREYASLSHLQKTLSQCGIDSGTRRVLLRVSFRASEQTLHDAMEEIGKFMKDTEADAKGDAVALAQGNAEAAAQSAATKPPAVEPASADVTPDQAAPAGDGTTEPSGEPMDTEPSPAQPEQTAQRLSGPAAQSPSSSGPFPDDPLQPTGIFSAPTASTPAAALTTDPDHIFEPSIAHAQLRQHQLQQRAQNTRLKSDAELAAVAAAQAARLASVLSVAIKVRFPDGMAAQWTVGPAHTGAFLHAAVRGVMRHPEAPFKLVVPGGSPVIEDRDDEARLLIKGYGFRGNVLVNLLWEEGASEAARRGPFLKDVVARQARALVVPEVPQGEGAEDEGQKVPTSKPKPSQGAGEGGGEGEKKPKWFKLGKR